MFHNPPTTSILSYSVVKDGFVRDNEVKVEMNPYKNLISFMKTDDRVKIEAKYVSQFRKWKYICIVYQYGMRIDVYVDGLLRDYKILKPSEETRPIKGGGILILGQEQDDYGKMFDSTESLSGTLSQVNIWSSLLNKCHYKCLTSVA